MVRRTTEIQYNKIVEPLKRGTPRKIVQARMSVSPFTVQRAVNWYRKRVGRREVVNF